MPRADAAVTSVGAGFRPEVWLSLAVILTLRESTYEASRTGVLGSGVRRGECRRSSAHNANEQRLELHLRRQRQLVPVLHQEQIRRDDGHTRRDRPCWGG